MTRSIPRPRRGWALALGASVAIGCGDPSAGESGSEVPAAEPETIAFASPEEMELELVTLGQEIQSLEEFLDANPARIPLDPMAPDPRALLDAARSTRTAAGAALAAADTAGAADSLRAAAALIEDAKRLLGVAEEVGIEFDSAAPPLD